MAYRNLHSNEKPPRYYSNEIITRLDNMLACIPQKQRAIATDHVLTEMARRHMISQQLGGALCN